MSNSYRFGVLERRGSIAGFRSGQIGVLAGALVVAVIVLRSLGSPIGELIGFVVVSLAVACVTVPVGGLCMDQWLPVIIGWKYSGGSVKRLGMNLDGHYRITSPESDLAVSELTRPARPTRPASWPAYRSSSGQARLGRDGIIDKSIGSMLRIGQSAIGRCDFYDIELQGVGRVGICADREYNRYCIVLAVRSSGFNLLDPSERDQKVNAWSSVLASLSRDRSPIGRIQWMSRSCPGDPSHMIKYLENNMEVDISSKPGTSYHELLMSESSYIRRGETYIVISTDRRSSIRSLGASHSRPKAGERPTVDKIAGQVLCDQLGPVVSELSSASIEIEGVLDSEAVEHLFASTFRSISAGERARSPWPISLKAQWSTVITDDLHHVIYWIEEWPRTEVPSDFMAPLLLAGSARVLVSVTMEPIDSLKAARQIENARLTRAADDELRRRGGFTLSVRRKKEEEVLCQREIELANGHTQYRFSGYVMVSGRTEDELNRNCALVEQCASRSFLSLRRLYGDQERALSWVLPICRGLA